MAHNEFFDLLGHYLEPHIEPSFIAHNIEIVWERDDPEFGSLHIWGLHGITEEEGEQVILEAPPEVEVKRHPYRAERVVIWGATRFDKWLFIVCDDWEEQGTRFLRPITAFEPEYGIEYWESHP